jgi:hypothetical protein
MGIGNFNSSKRLVRAGRCVPCVQQLFPGLWMAHAPILVSVRVSPRLFSHKPP